MENICTSGRTPMLVQVQLMLQATTQTEPQTSTTAYDNS
jgi:hypothetical protein